jgi:hypothetical protein
VEHLGQREKHEYASLASLFGDMRCPETNGIEFVET